jgi:CrcB protein
VSPLAWVAFAAAAGIGAPARYLLDSYVQDRVTGVFPWGTLAVNITGCFALGLLTGLGLHHGLDATTRTVVGIGGLGAYTTFSTFTVETVRLAEEGALELAVRNVALGVVLGLLAATAGLALTAL